MLVNDEVFNSYSNFMIAHSMFRMPIALPCFAF